jgi:hypothetical protein
MPPLVDPAPVMGTTPTPSKGSGSVAGGSGSEAGGELMSEVGVLLLAGVLVGLVVLVRRWVRLRSRPPLPGLPRERVLPISRHGTLHDPKYLGRILEAEDPPPGP